MGLSRDSYFWESFVAQADAALQAARLLPEMLDHLDTAADYSRRIQDLEHEGDKITHDTLSLLHKTWITPLDREEIHALIAALDDVLDLIWSAAERITLYGITELPPEARELASVVVDGTDAVRRAVEALRQYKERERLLALCVEINQHENKADEIHRRALARLFRERCDPLFVLKWRDIYDNLEDATDRCEDVANIIEGIVLEHA